jgi:transcription termination factor Rho
VSETSEPTAAQRAGSLNSMLLPDLKKLAGALGISGVSSMKKAQILDAIRAHQSDKPVARSTDAQREQKREAKPQREAKAEAPQGEAPAGAPAGAPAAEEKPVQHQVKTRTRNAKRAAQQDKQQPEKSQPEKSQPEKPKNQSGAKQDKNQAKKQDNQQAQSPQAQSPQAQSQQAQPADGDTTDTDDEGGSRRNRRRRGRDRTRTAGGRDPEPQILDDDVLVPAAGILDVLENYAFVRTSGYLAGVDDVYLSLSIVKKYGLRRGDAIVGQVRQPREGERREKFNPMVRIDSVNGAEPDSALHRGEFEKLTPLHPSERLRLETDATNTIGRVIDLVTPVGKGQRGLIVSPANAGKTRILQAVAAAITKNNPECHLMVVLVDERPEEVTDFERSVKGEVIASAFDRPPLDHTTLAELAIERAKRLVELGHDVVVLLDGLTRLGRAHNLAASTAGRALPGAVDGAALYAPKKFFGAARNIENGGSLTILATAVVESGSPIDESIFEEFHGAANLELRLRRDLAERHLFPAVDVLHSGTRREEMLLSREETAILTRLRRSLDQEHPQAALEELLRRISGTQSNIELLTAVQRG